MTECEMTVILNFKHNKTVVQFFGMSMVMVLGISVTSTALLWCNYYRYWYDCGTNIV